MKTVFKLAFRNLVAYKRLFIQLTVAFVALIFLITLVSCFVLSINDMQNNIIYGNISESYTFGDKQIESGAISQKFTTQELTYLNLEDCVKEIYGFDIGYVSASYIGIIYNGQNVPCNPESYIRFSVYSADEWNIFTANDYKEAGKNAQFMVGRFPENANEVVVSQKYLEGCGLSVKDLGAKLTFGVVKYKVEEPDGDLPPLWELDPSDWGTSASDKPEDPVAACEPEIDTIVPVSTELTICGIILNDYYALSGHYFAAFCPTVLVDKSNAILDKAVAETRYMCSLDGWADKETEDYIKQAELNYFGDSSLRTINVTANLKMVVNRLALYFGSALVLGIIISAFLLVEKLCFASVKNSGIMLISGFTDKQTFSVMLVQILFTGVISFAVAILLTYGAMTAINNILFHTFWISFKVSTAVYFAVAAIGLAVVVVLSVVTLGYVAVKRKGKQTRELLDT